MSKEILHLALAVGNTSSVINEHVYNRSDSEVLHNILSLSGKSDLENNVFGCENSITQFCKQLYCKIFNKNVIFHIHFVHLVPLIYVIFAPFFFILRKKVLVTYHTSYSNYTLRNKVFFTFAVIFNKYNVFCSDEAYNSTPKLLKFFMFRHSVIKNGVDTNRIANYVASLDCKIENYDLVVVGRLVEVKNHAFLLDLMAYLPDNFRLNIVGDGPLMSRLVQQAEDLKIAERVIFWGDCKREDVYKILSVSGVFISSSKIEGLPISVLEAFYLNKLCFLSDINAHKALVEDFVCSNVFFFDSNKERLAEEIKFNCSHNIVCDSKSLVDIKYSLSKMRIDYDAIYKLMFSNYSHGSL